MAQKNLLVKGAREHNLKNVDIEIPRDKLVVFTGLSGSGKSSLAFDTIYAEGQRRYVESLSSYARQFLGQMEKPDVDSIDGFLRRFRSIRKPPLKTHALRLARSRKFMTICACCMPALAFRTARSAARRLSSKQWIKSWTALWRLMRARKSKCSRR